MVIDLAMIVILIALVLILFALLTLVGFSYLLLKAMQRAFGEYENNTYPNDITVPGPGLGDDRPGEVPLEQFTPDFKKPLKIKIQETDQGLEEVAEGDII